MKRVLLITVLVGSNSSALSDVGIYREGNAVILTGAVKPGDHQRFMQYIREDKPNKIYLSSPGGNLVEGLDIGLAVHANKLETIAGGIDDGECLSICAMIWLAGQPRTAYQGAKIGFHAAHDGKGNTTGGGNALAGAYLAKLGFSYTTIYALTTTKPTDMNYLTAEKAKEYGITYNFKQKAPPKTIGDIQPDTPPRIPGYGLPPPVLPPVASNTDPPKSETSLWKTVGGWNIRIDHTFNNGCYIVSTGSKGTTIRLGYDDQRSGYLTVAHSSWQSISKGQQYSLTIQFDNEPPWTGPGIGRMMGPTPAIFMKYSNRKLGVEFAQRQAMVIWYNKQVVVNVSLDGSYAAFMEMVNCQRVMDGGIVASDPFR